MMLESKIEEALRIGVEEQGGLCIKLIPTYFKGLPDRMILMKSERIFFVETKRNPRSVLQIRQKFVRNLFRSLGFKIHKLDSIGKVYDFLAMLKTLP